MALGSTAWFGLLAAAPVAPTVLAAVAYGLGSVICHQLPDRSFHLADAQLAVCARCTGIYAGAAGAFIWQVLDVARVGRGRVLRREGGHLAAEARRWLLIGVAPTLLTVLLEWAGWWAPSNVVRSLAGVLLGVAVALVAGRAATLHLRMVSGTEPTGIDA